MSWFKKLLNTDSSDIASDEVIDPFSASPERNQEFTAQVNANQELAEMEAIQEEREKEEKAQADQLVVVHGAKVKMGAHLGEFKVLNDVPTTQGKLTGTIVEKTIANFTFYDGFQLMSILGNWQNFGSYKVQDNEVLIKKSTLQVMGKMPGNTPPETGAIEIIDPGQINNPSSILPIGAPVPENLDETNPCSDDFTLAQIKRVWPKATNSVWLQGIVDELNKSYTINKESKKLYEIFELNTCLKRAHFFAQAFVESSQDLSGAFNGESLNYSVEALRSGYPFSVFKNDKKYYDYADKIGRKTEVDPKTKKKKVIQSANQEEIANIAYDDANRGKNYKLGNIHKGDGWKFRGRGLMQITGRSNYKSIQEIIDETLPKSGVDLSLGKDSFTAKEAVFAGLGDWILKKTNTLAEKGSTPEVVNSITAKINYSTKSYKDRRDAFLKTNEIFKKGK